MVRGFLTIACFGLIIGCGSTPTAPSDPPLSELLSAPTRIVVDGQALTLTAFLSRDFMPSSPPDGRPLGGVLRIKTEDGSSVRATVTADTSWIINKAELWASAVEQRPRSETAPNYEVVVRGGPKWSPDITVDVVVRLRDSQGRSILLRAPDQRIIATW
jgi:hypothetical protein